MATEKDVVIQFGVPRGDGLHQIFPDLGGALNGGEVLIMTIVMDYYLADSRFKEIEDVVHCLESLPWSMPMKWHQLRDTPNECWKIYGEGPLMVTNESRPVVSVRL